MADFLRFLRSQLFVTIPYPTTSFAGRTIIVTGSNVGLGKEAARHFARLEASTLILAVRDTAKGEAARQDILSTTGASPSAVQVWPLDLASYSSVITFADRVSQLPRLDYVIENAGIATEQFKIFEKDESTITVNVVSTFLLALLLLPKLKATAKEHNSRPVLTVVSSEVHGWIQFPEHSEPSIFTAINDPAKAKMGDRYPLSKLLEILVIREWAAQRSALEYPVTINTLTPGFCHSELTREAGWGVWLLKLALARTTEVGSRTLIDAAGKGPETHGAYLCDCEIAKPSPFVMSEEGRNAQVRVWKELREKLEEIRPGVTANL